MRVHGAMCIDHGGVICFGSHLRRLSDRFLFPFTLRAKTEGQAHQDIQGIEAPRCSLILLRILSDVEQVSFVFGRILLRSVASSKTGSG